MTKNDSAKDYEAIIREWEKTHRPSAHKSKLDEYDILIREKIEKGYTQQAIAELLCSLGCQTTHQNLSRYLKKHSKKNNTSTKPSIKNDDDAKSGFSTLRQNIRDQIT
jgi:hypothetical protein